MPSQIKAIIFDLGGVYFADGTAKAVRRFEEILHVPKSKLEKIFGGHSLGGDYRLGKIDEKKFWEAAKGELHTDNKTIGYLNEIWNSSYTRNWGMKTLIRKLRKCYKVAVLSDNTKERVEYLNRKYNLDKEFDCYVYSFEHGMLKPNKRLLKILFQKLNVKDDEVIIVDNSTVNVEFFRKFGVQTILFKSVGQVKRELSNLLKDSSFS
ncbi:MAG: NIF family HAD-type phosphatase [Nitrososphaeria archaeon]|jgi:putative hydrolase of the HAD superfamily